MKYLLYLSVGLIFFFTSCEDKKNTSAVPSEVTSEAEKNSEEKNDVSEEKASAKQKRTYPEITNQNMVEFLTKYGAENPETEVLVSTQHGDIEIEPVSYTHLTLPTILRV